MLLSRLGLVGLFAVVLSLSGCGGGGPVTISGKVTFDGTPVEAGLISFEDVDGKTSTAEGAITNGEYSVTEMPRGAKKVKITASRKIGERPAYAGDPNSKMIDNTEPYIPAKYNDQTTLTYDAIASATKDFALTK